MTAEQKPGGRNVGLSAGLGALLPCPFCGGEAMFRKALWPSDGDVDAILHRDPTPHCGLTDFRNDTTDGQIIDAWNRRAPNVELTRGHAPRGGSHE